MFDNAQPKTGYKEFVALRDAGKVPEEITWAKWKGMTQDERNQVISPGWAEVEAKAL